jgi:hypothetical protein
MELNIKKTKIQEIINSGSAKEKINLYMEDIAMRNITYDFDNPYLTDSERSILSESIDNPKDVKYYNQLARYSRAFLMYKPYLSLYKSNILLFSQNIDKLLSEIQLNKNYNDFYKEMIDLNTDPIIQKKITLIFNKKTKKTTQIDSNITKIEEEIQKINDITQTINLFYAEINTFLKRYLPLKPYIEFTKNEERIINETLKEISKKTNKLPIAQIIPYDSIFVLVSKQAIDNIIKASK